MSAPLVHVRDLVKTFGGGDLATLVLRGVDLDLSAGGRAALVGPSGSGKSTLLTILGTLQRPTSGRLEIDGRSLVGLTERELTAFRNARLGFVFQFHHLLPDFTAWENVLFPAFGRPGGATRADRERATELLKKVGLAHRSDFLPGQLSGGQKQRVAIARALINRPNLVLADEPTGNLDREAAAQVIALIEEISRSEGTAFVLSTHDAEIASRCPIKFQIEAGTIRQTVAEVTLPSVAATP